MTQKERVAILRQEFEGYDPPLDSKVMRPSRYGITLSSKARKLLKSEKKKAPVYKLTIRLDREQEEELRKALNGREPAEWVREMAQREIMTHRKGE